MNTRIKLNVFMEEENKRRWIFAVQRFKRGKSSDPIFASLGKVSVSLQEDLKAGLLVFEQRHNSRYRYSNLGGENPMKALTASNAKLWFPCSG
jgi:hypothetical protein